MPINSRRKGHNFERAIVNELKEFFPNIDRSGEGSKTDQRGIDLVNTGEFDIQCKRGKKYANPNVLEQIEGHGIPIVITKMDRKKSVVIMYLDDFKKKVLNN